MKGIAILGSTGSIGRQTLDVIRALNQEFRVIALAAGSNHKLLAEQVAEFRPKMVWAEGNFDTHDFDFECEFIPMEHMVADFEVDLVMVATTGRVGLMPTLEAIRHGKAVALANKYRIDMPISVQMKRLLDGEITAQKALEELFTYPVGQER